MAVVQSADVLDAAAGAGAVIAEPLALQQIQRGAIGVVTLGLIDDLAVPVETIMFQRGQDASGGAGDFTRRVDIFDANQPLPALGASLKVASQSGNQRTEMQIPGRRWGKAPHIMTFLHIRGERFPFLCAAHAGTHAAAVTYSLCLKLHLC